MKCSNIGFLLVCVLALATVIHAEDRGVYRVSPEAQEMLIEMKSTVRHGRIGEDFIAELSPAEVQELKAHGFGVVQLFPNLADEDKFLRGTDGLDDFHSYQEIRDGFYALAAAYPNISQYNFLGNSVQNRDLFGLKITDNPQIEEDEPEVVFWGCIHGNEYTAAEIPYLYAIYLCQNYGVDPEVTAYVENNEIWCIPMINPDGRVNGTRNNANNVDLNREFGYNWDGWGGSWYPFSQVESRAVREFCLESNISLSMVFHCSGDEVYHPWGYFPHDPPDYDVLFRVGERYANAAQYAFMSSFNSYQTHGEVLDWAYGCLGGLSYTAEVSSFSSMVPTTFERNKIGMNLLCGIAGEGIHGTVTDVITGEPLSAVVWLSGNPISSYTDPEVGDVHRIVLPGTYDLTVWANGYQAQTVENVAVSFGSPGQFEVALEPGGGEYAFMVTSVNQEDPNNAYNNATYPAWALGPLDGIPCSLGSNGFIVLDMGEGHEITDGPGSDFTVTEVIHPRDPNPETYRVYAGDAYVQNILIGTATGTASFDLGSAGVTTTRYLKIEDASGSSPNLALAGMDLDGITVLNRVESLTGLEPAVVQLPDQLKVSAYPNPFNATVVIRYSLPSAGEIALSVFDVRGKRVIGPFNEFQNAGEGEIAIDGSNLPSGLYFYQLEVNQTVASGKILLLK